MRTSPTILPLRGANQSETNQILSLRGANQSETNQSERPIRANQILPLRGANQRLIRGHSEANQHAPAVAIHDLALVHEGRRVLEQHRDESA